MLFEFTSDAPFVVWPEPGVQEVNNIPHLPHLAFHLLNTRLRTVIPRYVTYLC
jgi:hypothetical protein